MSLQTAHEVLIDRMVTTSAFDLDMTKSSWILTTRV